MTALEIIISAIDRASEVIEGIEQKGSGALEKLEANWVQIGIAAAGAGLAIEGFARSQAPLTEKTNKLAASLDMTSDEVRTLAREMSDVTFPIEDALDLMEKGRQQGIRSAEGLREYAEFWDMVGDATGENAITLAESSQGLRAVGIAAGEESKALAAFGYISRETGSDVGEFTRFLTRTGPELQEMNLGINEAAAVMGLLEAKGMDARMAQQEFRSAVSSSNGDINEMLSALGITNEELDTYTQKVGDSSGVIQEMADIHAESYTIMEKFQHKISETMYQFGEYGAVLSNFTPILMGVGPAIKAVSVAKGVMTGTMAAQIPVALKLAAAQLALLAPYLLIVAAIVGLVALLWYLYKNWDDVVEKIAALWQTFTEIVQKVWEAVVGVFKDNWEKILMILFPAAGLAKLVWDNWGEITEVVSNIWEKVKEVFTNFFGDAKEAGIDIVKGLWEGIWSLDSWIKDKVWGFAKGIFGTITGGLGDLWPNSPSKAGVRLGSGLTEGIEEGIKQGQSALDRSTTYVEEGLKPELEASTILRGSSNLAADHNAGQTTENNTITHNYAGDTWHVTINNRESAEDFFRLYDERMKVKRKRRGIGI